MSDNEREWIRYVTMPSKFVYIAEPTELIREVLEPVFGTLDYKTPYV